MTIKILDPRIKRYSIIPYTSFQNDPRNQFVPFFGAEFEPEQYFVLIIEELMPGLMVSHVTSPDASIAPGFDSLDSKSLFNHAVYFIRCGELMGDVHIDFTFQKGYALRIHDDATSCECISYHAPGELVLFENEGESNGRVVERITGTGASLLIQDLFRSGDVVEREVSFVMPDNDVDIVIMYKKTKETHDVTIDLEGLEPYLYQNLPWANHAFECCFTFALYSDDYDFGTTDKEIFPNKPFRIPFGKTFRIKLFLTKRLESITALLNGKPIGQAMLYGERQVTGLENVWDDSTERTDTVYEYRVDLKADKDGELSFAIK